VCIFNTCFIAAAAAAAAPPPPTDRAQPHRHHHHLLLLPVHHHSLTVTIITVVTVHFPKLSSTTAERFDTFHPSSHSPPILHTLHSRRYTSTHHIFAANQATSFRPFVISIVTNRQAYLFRSLSVSTTARLLLVSCCASLVTSSLHHHHNHSLSSPSRVLLFFDIILVGLAAQRVAPARRSSLVLVVVASTFFIIVHPCRLSPFRLHRPITVERRSNHDDHSEFEKLHPAREAGS
jgi:hypothetical protein